MTVADAFETIVTSCTRHFRQNEALVVEQQNVEGLHQVRVAMRRLGAALKLFRPVVEDVAFVHIDADLDWFTRELGEARNFDVYLQRDLPEAERRVVRRDREEAYDVVIAAIRSQRLRRLMGDLTEWAAHGEWTTRRRAARPITPFSGRRIDRLWKRVTNADKLTRLSPKKRHRLRIQAKSLRYSLEFLRDIHSHPKRQRKFGKAIERLQDELGQANDFVVARRMGAVSVSRDVARDKCEIREYLRGAQQAMRRMRKVGRYWRD
jgi:CHAD domain-containing protein